MAATAAEPGKVNLGVVGRLVGYYLRRADGRFLADFNETVADTGMRQILVGILSIVQANPGVHQGRVGEALGIRRGNMVGLANELEEKGLVRRATDEDNRRALSLTLTAAGDDMLAACLLKIEEHENRMLAKLSMHEREQLVDLLRRVGSIKRT